MVNICPKSTQKLQKDPKSIHTFPRKNVLTTLRYRRQAMLKDNQLARLLRLFGAPSDWVLTFLGPSFLGKKEMSPIELNLGTLETDSSDTACFFFKKMFWRSSFQICTEERAPCAKARAASATTSGSQVGMVLCPLMRHGFHPKIWPKYVHIYNTVIYCIWCQG